MNNLSWVLYLANVIEATETFMILFLQVVIVLILVSVIVNIFAWDWYNYCNDTIPSTFSEKWKYIKGTPLSILSGFFIFFLIFVPSKNTLYMIAGSEYIEKITVSQSGKDIIDPSIELLKNYINSELKKSKSN